MSETYSNGTGTVVTFTRTTSGNANSKPANLSPRAISKKRFDTAIIEKHNGEIEVIEGIRATVIIAKAQVGDYEHILHWPKNLGRRKAAEIVVLCDKDGNLSLKEGESAKKIILGEVPDGFTVEFTPPKKGQK